MLCQTFKRGDRHNGVIRFGEFVRSLGVFHPNAPLEDNFNGELPVNYIRQAHYIDRIQELWLVLSIEVRVLNLILCCSESGYFFRPSFYDGVSLVLNVDGILSSKTPPRLWLNFQYEEFYNQHSVKLVDKVLEMLRLYTIDFVSSPEIGFLRSINGKVRTKTKFIFQFLNASNVEPTMNQPYDTIVKDLAAIKSYASDNQ